MLDITSEFIEQYSKLYEFTDYAPYKYPSIFKIHEIVAQRQNPYLTKKEFDLICSWKLKQFPNNEYEKNTDEKIRKTTNRAFNQSDFVESVKILDSRNHGLNGVNIPVATALLSISFPDKYCIFDKQTIKTLYQANLIDKDTYRTNYSGQYKDFNDFLKVMYDLKKKTGFTLRKIEKALFTYQLQDQAEGTRDLFKKLKSGELKL